MKHILTDEKKSQFIMAVLLNEMTSTNNSEVDSNSILEKYFLEMLLLRFVKIKNHFYEIDTKGQEFLENFFKKYDDFLKFYDIFCAVDLDLGEFAFSRFYDFDTDEEWKTYLSKVNWEDVRVAVCEFKKIDPMEIVFLSFLNEGRFNVENENWQLNLVSDSIWNEIVEICNTAIPLENLLRNDTIQDIINQGSNIMLTLLKEENNRKLEELRGTDQYEEEIVYVEEEIEYYEPYIYDPYYVSPCWLWYY